MWRYNTDGIDVVNSVDVKIDGCFIRSFDDSVCIKGSSKQDYWHGYPADAPMIQQGCEGKYTRSRNYCPDLLKISVSGKGGPIQDVRFKNLTVTGEGCCFPRSTFCGFDADHFVEDVTIENLHVFGKPVRNSNNGRFEIGPHARDIKFLLSAPEKDD